MNLIISLIRAPHDDKEERHLTCFPKENGTYLYLIMWLICRLMVTKKRVNQYMSRMGQKTGMSNIGKNVMKKATTNALVTAYLRKWAKQ